MIEFTPEQKAKLRRTFEPLRQWLESNRRQRDFGAESKPMKTYMNGRSPKLGDFVVGRDNAGTAIAGTLSAINDASTVNDAIVAINNGSSNANKIPTMMAKLITAEDAVGFIPAEKARETSVDAKATTETAPVRPSKKG